MADTAKPETVPKPLPSTETTEGIREILRRGGKGDEAVLPLLRRLFDRPEGGPELIDRFGDAYRFTRETLIKHAAGDSLVIQEALRRKIDGLRDDLAGPDATALERVLAERIALCWFDVHETDRRYSDVSNATLTVAEYRDGRRDRAQRRFLAACKTLATIRKLGLPAIQVNVARQQVNVAGCSS